MTEINTLSIINGTGIAKRFGVTPAAVGNWRNRFDFPKPLHTPYVVGIPLYRVTEVDKWARETLGHRPVV